MKSSPSYGKKRIYPPLVKDETEGVTRPDSRFELPPTHSLSIHRREFDKEYGEYIITILGFLLGLRLTLRGVGHLLPAPHTQGELVDFSIKDSEILRVLSKATEFWDANSSTVRKRMFGAVYWFLTAQAYDHKYERLAWLYTALDNMHKVALETLIEYDKAFKGNKTHAWRPINLSKILEIPMPSEFAGAPRKADDGEAIVRALIDARNNIIHEATLDEQPLGYAATHLYHNIIEGLKHFIAQVALGLLGVRCEYRNAKFSWQMHFLGLRD